jgi:hypothetical protein
MMEDIHINMCKPWTRGSQLLLNSLTITFTKMIITQKNGLKKTIQIMCEMKYQNWWHVGWSIAFV